MLLALLDRGRNGWTLIAFLVVMIPMLALWAWVLRDCAMKEDRDGNLMAGWILVIVLAGWVGALLYLFVRRPERVRALGR
jgi:hypothetical protein